MKDLVLPTGFIKRSWIEAEYQKGMKAAQELNNEVSTNQVNLKLNNLTASPGGINFLGKELRSPLLREMLYESVARNLAQVYKLSQGESAEFWSDVAVPAAAIGVDGLPGQIEIRSDYVRVDTRLFTANPYVRWNHSNLTKFDILNATQQRLKASLMLQEAAAWFRLVRFASGLRSGQGTTAGLESTTAATQNAPTSIATSTAGRLSVDQVAKSVANFGSRLIKGPKKLWINPQRQSDLVLFNFNGTAVGGGLGYFAPNTQEILLQKGNIGTWLGCEVYEDIVVPTLDTGVQIDSKDISAGVEDILGYILGPAEYVGLIAIRTDLSIETLKDATRFADVFAGWMDVGFFIRWTKALQRLTNL